MSLVYQVQSVRSMVWVIGIELTSGLIHSTGGKEGGRLGGEAERTDLKKESKEKRHYERAHLQQYSTR